MSDIKHGLKVISDMVKSVSGKAGVYRMIDKNDNVIFEG